MLLESGAEGWGRENGKAAVVEEKQPGRGREVAVSLPFLEDNTFALEVLVREEPWQLSVWVFVCEASMCGCIAGQGVHMCSRGDELYTGVERGGNIKVISFLLYPW